MNSGCSALRPGSRCSERPRPEALRLRLSAVAASPGGLRPLLVDAMAVDGFDCRARSLGWARCGVAGSWGGRGMVRQWAGAHPPHPVGQPSRRGKDRARRPSRPCLGGASLPRRCGRPLGVGFSAVPQMAAPASPPVASAVLALPCSLLPQCPGAAAPAPG